MGGFSIAMACRYMGWLLPGPQSNETATLQCWPVTGVTLTDAFPCPLSGSLTTPVQLPCWSAEWSIDASSLPACVLSVSLSLEANPEARTVTASVARLMRTTDSLQLLSVASMGNGTASAKPAIFPSGETTARRLASPRTALALILMGSSGPSPLQKPGRPEQTRTPRLSKLTPFAIGAGSLSGGQRHSV